MEKEKVKSDLRELRKITHSIQVALNCKQNHERRLEVLRNGKQTKETADEIRKLEGVLSSLNIEANIKKATALETIYMEAIGKLEGFDKTIIIDGYINGKPYWKIGRDIGYTEVGIRKRIDKAIEKLANLL
nr:MAG TPA: RNA polymerase sigma factor [Caudoviricetes sp.]